MFLSQYTRFVPHIGRPNDILLRGANPSCGCGQIGGAYDKINDPNVMHPSHFTTQSSMVNGPVTHNISSINSFNQVKSFWSQICPGAVALYNEHLKKLESTHPNKVLSIVREYTKAFQHEVNALNTKNSDGIKKELNGLKKSMKKVGSMIKEIAPKGMDMHKMIEKRHINTVDSHLSKHKSSGSKSTSRKSKRKSTSRRKSSKRKSSKRKSMKKGSKRKYGKRSTNKHRRTNSKRRTMKGGYSQFGSNIPNTPSHSVSVDGGYLMGTPGAVRTDNCVDNYNHFTGISL